MANISMSDTINATADQVWQMLCDFGSIARFLPLVSSIEVEGEGIGAKRILSLVDGAVIVERLDSLDHEKKLLTYSLIESPLPVQEYTGSMSVKAINTQQCEFSWKSHFIAEGLPEADVQQVIESIYSVAFDGLKKLYNQNELAES